MKGLNFGIRLAALFSAFYVLCGIIVYSIPGIGTAIFELLTHSTIQFSVQPFNVVNFIIGIVAWVIIGLIVGIGWAIICECCKEKN